MEHLSGAALAHLQDGVRGIEQLLAARDSTVALLDTTAALRQLSAQVRAALGVDVGFVGHVERPGTMVLRALDGNATPLLRDLTIQTGRGLGGLAMQRGAPTWIEQYAGDSSITHDFDQQVLGEGLAAMVAVPIVRSGRLLGIVYAANRRSGHFGSAALSRLDDLAGGAAATLEVAQRVEDQVDAAVQEERNRVSVELHDSLGALLFRIGAEVLDLRRSAATSPELAVRLETIQSQLQDAGAALRESLTALRAGVPTVLLPAALRSDCRAFELRTGTRARTVVLGELPDLDEHRVAAITAAVREGLLNVEKHASAHSVMVTVVPDVDAVVVAVSDDGLPEPTAGDGHGFGLAATRDRIERVGGTLSSVVDEDGGWSMRIRVPRA